MGVCEVKVSSSYVASAHGRGASLLPPIQGVIRTARQHARERLGRGGELRTCWLCQISHGHCMACVEAQQFSRDLLGHSALPGHPAWPVWQFSFCCHGDGACGRRRGDVCGIQALPCVVRREQAFCWVPSSHRGQRADLRWGVEG